MTACELTPSILSCDPSQFRPAVRELIEAGVEWIHFDVMDGQFVPPITFGHDLVASLRSLGETPFEAHLMTLTPERHFQAFVEAGCSRVTFHVEVAPHAHRLIQTLHELGAQAGVALNPGTPVEAVRGVLEIADLILVMTVNPGWGGQALLDPMLRKVEQLRSLKPDLTIQVDGGIDPVHLRRAREAGANAFVSGSFLVQQLSLADGVGQLRAACG